MGTVIIMITFYIHTGTLHYFPLLMSVPVAITIGLLNMANNIRDRKKDKESGRKTFVILVGKPIAVITTAALLLFSYIFIGWVAFFKPYGSIFMILTFLSLPIFIRTVKLMWRGSTPQELIPAMASMGKLNTMFGLLLTIGLLLYGITGI